MNEFRNLDPHMRSLALVGGFLQRWALVESSLNRILIKSIGLDDITGLIVVKNIQLRDKLKIINSSIRLSFMTEDDLIIYKKLIKNINDYSAKRNIIAHELFLSNDDENVEFLITKANDGLNFPKEIWSIDTFSSHFNTMDIFVTQLDILLSKISQAMLKKALMSNQARESIEGLGSLGLLSDLFRDPQDQP